MQMVLIRKKTLKTGHLKACLLLLFSLFIEDNIVGDGIHLLQGKKIEETTCQVKVLLFSF